MIKNREIIFEDAIKKAVRNGYEFQRRFDIETLKIKGINYQPFACLGITFDYKMEDTASKEYSAVTYRCDINQVLFDHSFCKALFGEFIVCSNCGYRIDANMEANNCCGDCAYPVDSNHIESWKYHGQKMFLAEDRIEYIKKFI